MTTNTSDTLVLFGATGDLAKKKLFPALYRLAECQGVRIPVIGVALSGMDTDAFRAHAVQSVRDAGENATEEQIARFVENLSYVDGDYRDEGIFKSLRTTLGHAKRPLYYLAILPSMFETVIRGLANSGCGEHARIIVEKPFGRDLASARELNAVLHEHFDEQNIYRIDHYMGKEAVQNLLYFRLANPLIETHWRREYVDSIQITMSESFGVETRGAFYESVGTLRDVVQNHLLEVLSLLVMDPPVASTRDAIRDEQVRALKGIQPIHHSDLIRGQYEGYRQEKGVDPNSDVETFVALRLRLTSWRWSGVPVIIRAGKRMATSATEVLVRFRSPSVNLFDLDDSNTPNHMRFMLSPSVRVAIGTRVKKPGEEMSGEPTELMVSRDGSRDMLAYERLLRDAIDDDTELFAREDWVEQAWRIVDPVLKKHPPVERYASGSWGPASADKLAEPIGGWSNPEPSKPAS